SLTPASSLIPASSVIPAQAGIHAQCSTLTIHFLTPTRIIYQGRMARRPQFHVLMRSLLRRLWLLAYFHDEPVDMDHKRLIALAEKIRLADAVMAGDDWAHYSSRQQRLIETEGVTGWITYEGELGPFLPYLQAGELLHVGKGTAFGMGRYRILNRKEKDERTE
ncbi:MAG: CRISPR system precrRNA processing endoribonuclease RAMP protein Cas6, partial [candidate division WOR-3 bacterium]